MPPRSGPTPGRAAPRLPVAELDRKIASIVEAHGRGMTAGIWLGGERGKAWYERNAGVSFPTASAIKTAYLIELFAAHAGHLDAPLPGLDLLLDRDGHPSLASFSRRQREDIRQRLRGASVRTIGRIMMARTRSANHVYNAAANVATAIMGGPGNLTGRIRARDPAFAAITVRRYMLADRRQRGDNVATAAALGAVLQRLAARAVPDVDAPAVAAMRAAIKTRVDARGGTTYAKTGYLPPDPIVRVWSGWWESRSERIVCVVMTTQPRAGARSADRLFATTSRIRNLLLARAKRALIAE